MARGDISVREAGKRGGSKVSKAYGKEFYKSIGHRSHIHDRGRSPEDYGETEEKHYKPKSM